MGFFFEIKHMYFINLLQILSKFEKKLVLFIISILIQEFQI
jgi:hypothetical protein